MSRFIWRHLKIATGATFLLFSINIKRVEVAFIALSLLCITLSFFVKLGKLGFWSSTIWCRQRGIDTGRQWVNPRASSCMTEIAWQLHHHWFPANCCNTQVALLLNARVYLGIIYHLNSSAIWRWIGNISHLAGWNITGTCEPWQCPQIRIKLNKRIWGNRKEEKMRHFILYCCLVWFIFIL